MKIGPLLLGGVVGLLWGLVWVGEGEGHQDRPLEAPAHRTGSVKTGQ